MKKSIKYNKSESNKKKSIKKDSLNRKKLEKYLNMEQKYLINPICKLIPLFNIDISKKKNIISSCFFKMKSTYKSFNKYINGLKLLSKNIDIMNRNSSSFKLNSNNNYVIRLFIDKSIYLDDEIMANINQLHNVECVLYECNDFKADDIYHYGVFGTLIRLFPMFNFKYNDSKYILITDIDETDDYDESRYYLNINRLNQLKNISNLNSFKNIDKYYAFFIGHTVLNGNIRTLYKNKIIPYVIMSNFISIKRLPNYLLINFLEKSKNVKILNKRYESYGEDRCDGNICYGIDEVLLNDVIIKNYIYKNQLPSILGIKIDIGKSIKDMSSFIKKKIINKQYIDKHYIKYVNMLTNNIKEIEHQSLIKKINYIEKQHFKYNKKLKKHQIITDIYDCKYVMNYYNLIQHLAIKQDYRLITQDSIKILLLDKYIGIKFYISINPIFTNNKTEEIIIENFKCELKLKNLK